MSKDLIENMIENERPTLSVDEKSALLHAIEVRVATTTPVASPYFAFIYSRTMPALIIILVLVMGSAGTVAASESSKPGDLLFPVERASERVRLALASEERKTELLSLFTKERLTELQTIIDEEATVATDSNDIDTSSASTTESVRTLEVEVKVFTDVTVAKIELNNRTTWFVTEATIPDTLITEIADRLNIERSVVEEVLVFETKDRASRPSERGVVSISDEGEERISIAVNAFLDYLEEFKDGDERLALLADFLAEIDNLVVTGRQTFDVGGNEEDSRIKINDDRIEIRDDGYRVRVDKDGDIKIQIKSTEQSNSDSKDDDEDDDSKDDEQVEDSLDDSLFRFEAEADVFTDITIVKVEVNGIENNFETNADTRDEIIDEIMSIYGLDRAIVEAGLDLNFENKASKSDDDLPSENSSYEDEDDDSLEYDDDSKDEDREDEEDKEDEDEDRDDEDDDSREHEEEDREDEEDD